MNSKVVNSIYNLIKTKQPKLFETYNFKYHTQKYKLKEIFEAILFFIKICIYRYNYL